MNSFEERECVYIEEEEFQSFIIFSFIILKNKNYSRLFFPFE